MAETYPISCVSCRRKKIKCNKLKPCNQCKKRQIICQFPATFRNIEINEDRITEDSNLSSFDSNELISIINNLKQQKQDVLNSNIKLNEYNRKLINNLNKLKIQSNYFDTKSKSSSSDMKLEDDHDLDDFDPHDHSHFLSDSISSTEAFKISGETSELGEKYYGPQSSSFMMETLINNKSNRQSPYENRQSFNYLDNDNNIKMKKSLIKKPLPQLNARLSPRENVQAIFKAVEKFFQNYSSNYYKTFVSKLNLFEFLNNYSSFDDDNWENDDYLLLLYMILIFSIERLTPIEVHDILGIEEKEYPVFTYNLIHNNLFYNFEKLRHNLVTESIITIQSYILCTEFYFIEQKYEECWSMMFHTCSIAYSIGLHVTNKLKLTKFNEIDLNVPNVDGSSSSDNKESNELGDNDFESAISNRNNELDDINKLKVWFTLRILSDKVCSILGRPNPISIQINSIILKYNQNYSNINLNQHSTSILLKIGLSECLRLSNMMLIENFMIDFTINDLLTLNSKFEKEIYLLELYLDGIQNAEHHSNKRYGLQAAEQFEYERKASTATANTETSNTTGGSNNAAPPSSYDQNQTEPEVLKPIPTSKSPSSNRDKKSSGGSTTGSEDSSNELSYDEFNYLPIMIDKLDLLNDLIVFYINKAKLFEPFIIKFNKNENDAILILKNISNSILSFLKLIQSFLDVFEIRLSKKKLDFTKIGKYFRINFPFLNSFIYQGVIIIFTLLNYKSNDFINLRYNDKFGNEEFLFDLKTNLKKLISIDNFFNDKIWSVNVVNLIQKNINVIETIEKQTKSRLEFNLGSYYELNQQPMQNSPDAPQQEAYSSQGSQGSRGNGAPGPIDQDLMNVNLMQTNEFGNFNLQDPFWITNPDNLPYYLSSPNEELKRQTEEEMRGSQRNPQANNMDGTSVDLMGNMTSTNYYQQPQPNKEHVNLNEQYNDNEKDSKKIKLDDFLPYNYRK